MVGVNLGLTNYWSANLVFNNLFKQSRDFFTRDDSAFSVDANGYPTSIASGQEIRTSLLTSIDGNYPDGPFVFEFDGDGDFKFSGDVDSYSNGLIRLKEKSNGIILDLTATSASDPLRNFRIYQQGATADGLLSEFVEQHKGFDSMRFMRVGAINQGYHPTWAERATPASQTQGGLKGMSIEDMIDICNTLNCDLHISVHHSADKTYIEGLANIIKARLNAGLKAWVEESNEVWNSVFKNQSNYHKQRGLDMGLDDNATTAKHLSHAEKTARIGEIMIPILGDRVEIVYGSIASNPWHTNNSLEYLTKAGLIQYVTAVTVAYYLAGELGTAANEETTEKMSVDAVLDAVEKDITGQADKNVGPSMEIAAKFGKKFSVYEGGPHLKAGGAAQENATIVSLFNNAGRHTRMESIVDQLLTKHDSLCQQYFGESMPFNYFENRSSPSKYGDFGLWRHFFDTDSPKGRGIALHMKDGVVEPEPVEPEEPAEPIPEPEPEEPTEPVDPEPVDTTDEELARKFEELALAQQMVANSNQTVAHIFASISTIYQQRAEG